MVSRGYFKIIGTYWDIQSKIKCPGKLLFKHEYSDKYQYLDYSKFISYIKWPEPKEVYINTQGIRKMALEEKHRQSLLGTVLNVHLDNKMLRVLI